MYEHSAHASSSEPAPVSVIGVDATDRPWLAHYPAGVPATLEYPEMSLADQLRRTAARHPRRRAIAYYGRHMTYAELDRISSRFANRLIEHGLRPGDRVLIVLPNLPQFMIAHFGILKAGGVVAALSPLLVEREIAELARDSGARFVVGLDRMWGKLQPLVVRGNIDLAIATGVHDYLPPLKRLLFPLKFRKEMVTVPHDPAGRVQQFRRFIAGASERDPRVPVGPDDPAAFQYTGGTTGLPKAAVLTHRNLIANAVQSLTWVTDLREAGEVVMAIMPFFHSYGVTLCLNIGIQLAATSVLAPRFDVADVMTQIERYQPTLLPGVPTLYSALIGAAANNPRRQRALRSIRRCISGGAPLPAEVRRRFEELTGGRLVEGYGLTEASPVTHCNPLDGRARHGTIGLPLPDTDARIVDLETREPLPPGERGELAIRGPQVMRGYWERPDDTAAVLSPDGWLYTGDVAVMDKDGFFQIVDRQKDIIITGGENIYPREVEEVLYQHPRIKEAAVIGVRHVVAGQVAKAFIVPKEGETLTRREVLQFCAERLARHKIPRRIEFREALPRTPAGKILRRALAEEESLRHNRDGGSDPDAGEA